MEQEQAERYKSRAQHRSVNEVRWGTTLTTGPTLHEPPWTRKRDADEATRHHRDPAVPELPRATVPTRCCRHISVQLRLWRDVQSICFHKYDLSNPIVPAVSISEWDK